MTYMRVNNLTQQQFCDELFDCYTHLLAFDFRHAYNKTRRHAYTFNSPLDTIAAGHYRLSADRLLEPYGFHAVKIPLRADGSRPKVEISKIKKPKDAELRWALIDEPGFCYLLLMHQPNQHQKLPHRGHSDTALPVISCDIRVK